MFVQFDFEDNNSRQEGEFSSLKNYRKYLIYPFFFEMTSFIIITCSTSLEGVLDSLFQHFNQFKDISSKTMKFEAWNVTVNIY